MTPRPCSLVLALTALAVLSACTTTKSTLHDDKVLERGAGRAEPVDFTPGAMVNVADKLRDQGDHMSALRLYHQARERDPDHVPALLGEGESLLALGAAGEARLRFAAALKIEPHNARAEAGLGRTLLRMGAVEEALPHFRAALSRGEPSPVLYSGYGIALDLLGRHEEAQVQYGQGLDLKPDEPSLINNLALSFALGGDYGTAVRLLSALVTRSPDAAAARGNLALVYGLSGDMEAAEKMTALDLAGTDAQNRLGYIRQVARLDASLRPRAIILGLDAVAEEVAADLARQAAPGLQAEVSPPVASLPNPEPESDPDPDPEPETEAEAAPTATAASHGVQLGAYPSREIAAANWLKLQRAAPDLLAAEEPYFWQTESVVRLVVPTPDGWSAASSLCDSLQQAGLECLPRRLTSAP